MKRRGFLGWSANSAFAQAGAFCNGLGASQAADTLPADTPQVEAAWAEEWRALRRLQGHFDGGAYNEAVDRWQGRKHQLMQALAERLVHRRALEPDVLQTLGRPDARLRPHDAAYARVASEQKPAGPAGSTTAAAVAAAAAGSSAASGPAPTRAATPHLPTFWLYRWRGQHDQLVLSLQQGRAVAAAWLYTYE